MLTGLAEDRIKQGLGFDAIPPALQNIPDIKGDEWILTAFWELSTCRSIGMGAGPIPWTSIKEYANELELEAITRELFFDAVRYLDIIYLEHVTQENANASKKGNTGRKNNR